MVPLLIGITPQLNIIFVGIADAKLARTVIEHCKALDVAHGGTGLVNILEHDKCLL